MHALRGTHQRGVIHITLSGYGSRDHHGKYLCDRRVVNKQVYVQATSIHFFLKLQRSSGISKRI